MSVSELEDCEFLKKGLDELVEFDQRCSQFVERMRLAASFELVQRVKAFVNDIFALQLTDENEASQLVRSFYEEMRISLREHSLWREEELEWAIEALEKYLAHKLYKMTYYLLSSSDHEEDERFYHKIRTLQFLKPEHLDIPPRALNRMVFEMAVEELARTDHEKCKAPKEKLTCILNCIKILTNLLKHYEQEKGTGADSLLPYIIYTILLLSPKHMHSNLRYIRRFRQESQLKGEASYYFTQMESAVMFIAVLDHKSLSISEEDFKTGVERIEERIASGLDIIPSRAGHPLRARPSFTSSPSSSSTAVAGGGVITPGNGMNPSSPIIERRTSVLNEWSNLQKSHLSRADSKEIEPASRPPPSTTLTTLTTLPPSSQAPPLLHQHTNGGYVTQDQTTTTTTTTTTASNGFISHGQDKPQLNNNNTSSTSVQDTLHLQSDASSGYITRDQISDGGCFNPPASSLYQSGGVAMTTAVSSSSSSSTTSVAVGDRETSSAGTGVTGLTGLTGSGGDVQQLLQLDFDQLTVSDLKRLHAKLKIMAAT